MFAIKVFINNVVVAAIIPIIIFSKEFADKDVPVKTFGCQPTRKLSLPIGGDDNCALMITQIKTIMNVLINRMIIVMIYFR